MSQTYNITNITTAWSKVADEADDPIMVQCKGEIEWEAFVNPAGTGTPSGVEGHSLFGKKDIISRQNIGSGDVYVRVIGTSQNVLFAVTK